MIKAFNITPVENVTKSTMPCWNVKKVKSAIQKFFGAFCLINLSKTAIRGFVFSLQYIFVKQVPINKSSGSK